MSTLAAMFDGLEGRVDLWESVGWTGCGLALLQARWSGFGLLFAAGVRLGVGVNVADSPRPRDPSSAETRFRSPSSH